MAVQRSEGMGGRRRSFCATAPAGPPTRGEHSLVCGGGDGEADPKLAGQLAEEQPRDLGDQFGGLLDGRSAVLRWVAVEDGEAAAAGPPEVTHSLGAGLGHGDQLVLDVACDAGEGGDGTEAVEVRPAGEASLADEAVEGAGRLAHQARP